MMRLQLIDHDGETVITEFELGSDEGQWDIWNADEADQLIATLQKEADCD